jgi:O-antigen ligase
VAFWALLAVLSWLIATQPVALIAGVSLALFGLIGLLRFPWLLWLLLALLLPFAAAQRFGAASLADLLLAAALAFWFVEGARRRTIQLTILPILPALLLYLAAMAVSLLAAADLDEAMLEVVKWAEFGVILAVVPTALPANRASWLAAALLLAAVAQAGLGLYQFLFRIGPEWFLLFDRFMRASGSFAQPNPFAGYLGLTLPVAVSLMLWAWNYLVQRRNWPALGWTLFYTSSAMLIAAGLAASWSRGGWFGAAAGVALTLAARSRVAAMTAAVVAAVLLATVVLGLASPGLLPEPLAVRIQDLPSYFGLANVLSQPLTDENFAVVERVAHWVAAIRMWEAAPWFGIGPGNYDVLYPSVRLPLWEEPLGHAHNIYLNVLAETGLMGGIAFLILWGVVIVWIARCIRTSVRPSWQHALACGLLGMIAGQLTVHSLFDNLFVQGIYLHIALWIALLACVEQLPRRTQPNW